jgi:hypothetical protein
MNTENKGYEKIRKKKVRPHHKTRHDDLIIEDFDTDDE